MKHRTPSVSAEDGSLRIPPSEESASKRPGIVVWGSKDRGGEDAQKHGGDFRLGSHFRTTPRASRTEDPSRERIVRAPDAEPAGSAGEGQAIVPTVVYSVALYGAPVWTESVAISRPLLERAIQLHKASLNKVATAYRDVAAEWLAFCRELPRSISSRPRDSSSTASGVAAGRGGLDSAGNFAFARSDPGRRVSSISIENDTGEKYLMFLAPEWGTGWGGVTET